MKGWFLGKNIPLCPCFQMQIYTFLLVFLAFRRTVVPQSSGQKMDEAGSLKACLCTKLHGITPLKNPINHDLKSRVI